MTTTHTYVFPELSRLERFIDNHIKMGWPDSLLGMGATKEEVVAYRLFMEFIRRPENEPAVHKMWGPNLSFEEMYGKVIPLLAEHYGLNSEVLKSRVDRVFGLLE